jgi:hypothetical protein
MILFTKIERAIKSLFNKEPLYNCTVAFPNFKILYMRLNEHQINDINCSVGTYIINQDEVQRNITRNKKELLS